PVVTRGSLFVRQRDASGDAGSAGPYGAAGTLRVARRPTDGHVDADPGGGALFLRLTAPEAVLPVLARPVAALPHDGTRGAHGTGLALAQDAGLGSLTGGSEEQLTASLAGRVA